MAQLAFANGLYFGAANSTGEFGSASTRKLTIQELSSGEQSAIDLTSSLGNANIKQVVANNSSNYSALLYAVDEGSNRDTDSTHQIWNLDIQTGQAYKLYELKADKKKLNMITNLSTDVLGNVYFFNEGTFKTLGYDKSNKFTAIRNDFTRSFENFTAIDVIRKGNAGLEGPKDTETKYSLKGFFPASDGSIYLLGKVEADNDSNPRLFLVQQIESKQQQKRDPIDIIPLTSAKTPVLDVLPLNASNALVLTQPSKGKPEWKAYSSASGPIDSTKDQLISIDYNSPFFLNTLTPQNDFRLPPPPHGDRIAGNANLNFFVASDPTQSDITSSYLTALLPMQPGVQRFQLSDYKVVSLPEANLQIALSTCDSSLVLQINSLDSSQLLGWDVVGLGADIEQTLIHAEPTSQGLRIHVVSFGASKNASSSELNGWLDQNMAHHTYLLSKQGDRTSLSKIESKIAQLEAIESIQNGQSIDAHAWRSMLGSQDGQLLAINSGQRCAVYRAAFPGIGVVAIKSRHTASLVPQLQAVQSQTQSAQSYVIGSHGSSRPTWSDTSTGEPAGQLGDGQVEEDYSWEAGASLGITIPTKTNFFDSGKGKWANDKLKFTQKDPVKNPYGSIADGNVEIEVKGGLKGIGKQKNYDDPGANWKWLTTFYAEGNLTAKLKLGPVKTGNVGYGTTSPYAGTQKAKEVEAYQKQSKIVENNKKNFNEQYMEAFEHYRDGYFNDMRNRGPQSQINSQASQETMKEFTQQAQDSIRSKNAAAANTLQQLSKDAKPEEKQLSISANLGGYWTYKSDDITSNLGDLSKFKLDAGATLGFKMPLRNLGTIAALYFIVGVSVGFRWTREWKAVESAEELQLLLGDFPSISDLIEVVTDTGKSIASLSIKEQRALEPEQVRWRFKFNPANLLPADLVAQIQTIQSISQAAADVMMYIPPGLFATLAMKLAASVGGNAIQTEPATTTSGPASSTSLLEAIYAPEASDQLSSRAAFAARRQQPSTALNILQDASDLYGEDLLNSGDQTVTDAFGFYIKLKELGVQGTAALLSGGIDLDLKAYLGGEFSGSWGGGKEKLAGSVGIGASANIKFLCVTIPLSFYYTFLQWQKTTDNATAATFYQSQDFSLAYKNLMAAENFSPVIDIQPSPAAPIALIPAAETSDLLSLQSGSPNDIDFLATYVNTAYSGAYSYGVFATPAVVDTSKTGQLVTAYSIRGQLRGNGITWDRNSVAPLTTGFITDVTIPSVLYNKELGNYMPVIAISGVGQQSDAATYTSLIKATSQISGSINYYALKDSKLEQTGSLTSTVKFNASQFGIENAFIKNAREKMLASSMPNFDYGSGAVYLQRQSPSDFNNKSVYVQGRVELRYSSDPADQVRFGTALSTSRGLNGMTQSLTIAMNGGQAADIPVSYTLNKPELYTGKHVLKEQADYTHALYSALSRNDIKGRSVADIATTSFFTNTSSGSPQSPLHWQAVAYKDTAGSLQRSIIQLTRTQYNSTLKLGEDRTFFLTHSSVDSLRFSNDFFSGSLGSYSLADGSTAVAVGGTGFATLMALEKLDFHTKQFSGSPFLQLRGLDKVPTLLMETEFIIEGKEYGLWLEFALPATNITQPDAPLDLNALTREQLLNACIRSVAKYDGDVGNLHSGVLVTDNVLDVAFDGKSLSLKLDGKSTFSPASTPVIDLANLPITIRSSPKATNPSTALIANAFTVRFNSISQPLHLSSVDALPTSGVSQQSQWLAVATDDSDGHSLLYLITDHSLIESSLQSGQASTLWLDQNPSTEAGNVQFVQGVTGLAFNQGSTIATYIGSDGGQYLIIGDPIFYNQSGSLDQRGRVFQIALDETLMAYAKSTKDVPFINPLEYLKRHPTKGAVIEGTVENGLFGESLLQVPTDSGYNALVIGQPGVLDVSAITKISDTKSQTRLLYTPFDQSQPINVALTNPGFPADKVHYFTSGFDNQFQQKGIVFSLNAPPINGGIVQNQDLYSYGLENLPTQVTKIPKDFNGVISSIGSSVVPGSRNSQAQLDLLVTDSATGYNYPMASQLGDSSSISGDASWSAPSVQWPLLNHAGLLTSDDLSSPRLTEQQILHTINLLSSTITEGEPISFTVTNNSDHSLELLLRLEDATGYEGRDYTRFRTRLELSPGETSAPLTTATLDRSGYLPTRIVRLVSKSIGASSKLQGVGSKSHDILIQSNDDLDLSKIGTGAAVKASNNNAVALASSPLPGKDQSNRGALALFSGELDAKGLLTKPYISVLKNTDKNYDLSKDDASSKKFLLPADFIPVQAGLIKLGSSHVLAYSGLNATTQGSELYLAAVPDQGADLIGKTSSYFLDQTTKITSSSPTFGQSMISFAHGGKTYFAIADPSSDSVYIVPAQTLELYLNKRQSNDVGNLLKEDGVKRLFGVKNSLFGTSVAEGKLHGVSSLVIGAPQGAENRDASVPTYGGSVYIVNLGELVKLTAKEINLAHNQRADAFGLIRVDGTTSVDLDPSSSTYLASEGAAIGSSLLFAKITDLKGSTDDQLLLGAPGFVTGDWSTGAVFVLNPTSAGLHFADLKTSTKIVSFNPSAFATGLQTDLSGVTFIGDDGDEIGSSLLNLEQFTSGFEFGERNVSNKDVIAIPAPSRFGGAGGVYVYIGNNNEQLALNQLNPSSLYDHTFQYVGTVEGDLPELGIPPRFQVGLQTHSIGKFSQPVPGLGQGNDFSLSIFNTSDPGAVLIYGKPYLYPGTTTSVFDIAAAGFGKPLFGSGNPVGIGDVNLDGVDDFVLQSWNLNGRSTDGTSPDSTLYFGASPTVLTDYQPFKIPSKLTGWELNGNLAFGAIDSSGIGQSTLVRSSLPGIGALYSLNGEMKGVDRTPYLNSRKSPLSNTDYKLSDYPILSQGNFIESQPAATSLLGLRYYAATNTGSLSIANQIVGSNTVNNYSLQFDKKFSNLTSLLAAEPLRPSDRVGSILMGVVAPSQTQTGKATFELQEFRISSSSSGPTVPTKMLNGTSFDEPYASNVRYLVTGQFSFNGVSYLTTAKTASTGIYRHWQLAVVNTQTRTEFVLDEGKVNSALAANWLDNLSQAALVSSIGDWNGDGVPDVAYTQLQSDWQQRVSESANPFVNVVRFGTIDIAKNLPFESRYQLRYELANRDRIVPLSRQTPNQLTAIGDADGSGATSLLASPLPRTDALPQQTISNAFSFQLFPSERAVGKQQKFSGSEGDDLIVIDASRPIEQAQAIVNLEQGDDTLGLDWFGINQDVRPDKPRLYVSGGSGDDVVTIRDGALLQPDSRVSAADAQIDLVYNAGSGFDVLSIGSIINGFPDLPIELTRLLNQASGLDEIQTSADLSIDLKALSRLSPVTTSAGSDALYISGAYGTKITFRNSSSLAMDGLTTHNNANYVGFSDSLSGRSFYLQQGLIPVGLPPSLAAGLPTAGAATAQVFDLRAADSTPAAPDSLTGFRFGTDRISLAMGEVAPFESVTFCSRAANNRRASTLLQLAQSVFADADGLSPGQQPLAPLAAAIVKSVNPLIAGTYLVINDATPGLDPQSDAMVRWIDHSGLLPTRGPIPVDALFV